MSTVSDAFLLGVFTYFLTLRHENSNSNTTAGDTSGGVSVSASPRWTEIYLFVHFLGICVERQRYGMQQRRARRVAENFICEGDENRKKDRILARAYTPYTRQLDRVVCTLVFFLLLTRIMGMATGKSCLGAGVACGNYYNNNNDNNNSSSSDQDGFRERWGWPLPFESNNHTHWMGVDLQGWFDCAVSILAVLMYMRVLGVAAEWDRPVHAPFKASDRPTQHLMEPSTVKSTVASLIEHPFAQARAPETSTAPSPDPPLGMTIGRLVRVMGLISHSIQSFICVAIVVLVGFAAALQYLTSTNIAYAPTLPLSEEGFHTDATEADAEKFRTDFGNSFPQAMSMLLYGALGYGGAEGVYTGPAHLPSHAVSGTAAAGGIGEGHHPGKPFSDACYLLLFATAAVVCNALLLGLLHGMVSSTFSKAAAAAQKHVIHQWAMLCWTYDQHRMDPALPPPLNLVVGIVAWVLRSLLLTRKEEANEIMSYKDVDSDGFAGEEGSAALESKKGDDGDPLTDWVCGYCLSQNYKSAKSQVVFINYMPDWHDDQAESSQYELLNQPIADLNILTAEGETYQPKTKGELLWWTKMRADKLRQQGALGIPAPGPASASHTSNSLHLGQYAGNVMSVAKLCAMLHSPHGSYCRGCQRSRRELLVREHITVKAEELVATVLWVPFAFVTFIICLPLAISATLIHWVWIGFNYAAADGLSVANSAAVGLAGVDPDDEGEGGAPGRTRRRKAVTEERRKELVARLHMMQWQQLKADGAVGEHAASGFQKRLPRVPRLPGCQLTSSVGDLMAGLGHTAEAKQSTADARSTRESKASLRAESK
jgi:hypothetical protein